MRHFVATFYLRNDPEDITCKTDVEAETVLDAIEKANQWIRGDVSPLQRIDLSEQYDLSRTTAMTLEPEVVWGNERPHNHPAPLMFDLSKADPYAC